MRLSCISETSSTEVKFYYNYFAFPWNFPFPRPPSLPCLKTTSLYGFLLHQFQKDFIFFSIEEFYDSINRSIKKFYQDFQEKWRKNFLLENFTEIIKSLIKILAPQFFSTFKHSHTRDSTKLSHLYSHGIPSRKFHSGEIQYIQPRRIPRIVKRIPIKRLLKVARVIVEPRNVLKGEHNPTNLHSLATPDFHYHCQRYPSIQKRFYRWPTGFFVILWNFNTISI